MAEPPGAVHRAGSKRRDPRGRRQRLRSQARPSGR